MLVRFLCVSLTIAETHKNRSKRKGQSSWKETHKEATAMV